MRQRAADAAAAGAEVENAGVHLPPDEYLKRRIHEHLGVHARDEHVGRDRDRQAVKFPLADQVGQRLTGDAPLQQRPDLLFVFIGGVQAQVAHELLLRLADGICHQQPRLERVGLHTGALERRARGQIQIVVGLWHLSISSPFVDDYQVSLPFCSGMTSSSARMAHSIMLSSGSLVVRRCSHLPGADRMREQRLSCRPTQRLIS